MALIQIIALGASDNWLSTANADAMPYNLPSYNYCSFTHGDDIDTNVDDTIFHMKGIEFPFSVKKEKAATKIQHSWRNAIANPSYDVCKRRLLREYHELV
jgi:hypothetical protein